MRETPYPWQIITDKNLFYLGWYDSIPHNTQFHLHWHDEYEIFLFIEGDAKYIVEEKTYTLSPYDIIIIRKHEMHRIQHNSSARYKRCVLMISPKFFQQYACPDYEAQFLNTSVGNKIPGEIVRSNGLYDAFLRYRHYTENRHVPDDSPLLRSVVTEILYLLNENTGFSKSDFTKGSMKSVLVFLNNNYTDDISLDMLADKFYLSKHYLCRAFHKATGLTVHEYICSKRLALVRELRGNGMNLGEAAMAAGFRDYSSFYRAYVKQHGISPKEGL